MIHIQRRCGLSYSHGRSAFSFASNTSIDLNLPDSVRVASALVDAAGLVVAQAVIADDELRHRPQVSQLRQQVVEAAAGGSYIAQGEVKRLIQ